MGRHMASNLLAADYELTVHDRRSDLRALPMIAGARWASTPKELAEASQVVITSLPGPQEVDEVVLGREGVLEGLAPSGCLVDMTTSKPSSIRKIGIAAADRGVDVLDAPVAGGIRGARKATLTIMVGGSEAAFAVCEPILKAMGDKVFLVGGLGAGHTAKLVNNMMTIGNALIAMEAMVVGAKGGVDVNKLLEVADAGTGASYSLNLFRYVIFKGAFEPAKFALHLAAKDLRIACEYAAELGVPLDLVREASRALAGAEERGLGDKDWSSYITMLEEAAGVEVRA